MVTNTTEATTTGFQKRSCCTIYLLRYLPLQAHGLACRKVKVQHDPFTASGEIFDHYKPVKGDGLYEKYLRGGKVEAGWVNSTDFEPQPIKP